MYKKWLLVMLLLPTSNMVLACDLCTVYLGIQPKDFKHSFQLRHRYRLFKSDYINQGTFSTRVNNQRVKTKGIDKHAGEATSGIGSGEKYTYCEAYNSFDLVANIYLSQRWQLNGSISFSDNYVRQNDSIVDNVGGIGDLKLLGRYTLINSKQKDDSSSNYFSHRVNIGVGLSLPTGSYNKYSVVGFVTEFKPNSIIGSPELELDPHIQAGTGSFGYIGLIEYQLRYNIVGFNTNLGYQINSKNKNNFRLSNRLNANGSLFFIAKISTKIQLMPNLGIAYEISDYDIIDGEIYIDSGGEAAFLNQGITAFIGNMSLGLNFFLPAIQKMHGSQPLNNRRFITQLTYFF